MLRVVLVDRLDGSVTHETEDDERAYDGPEPPMLHGSQASEAATRVDEIAALF